MTDVELYRLVTECRAILRPAIAGAMCAADDDPKIVRAAVEAEISCELARVREMEGAA